MYYLVIKNLGIERCVDLNVSNVYKGKVTVNCENSFKFKKRKLITSVTVRCTEPPHPEMEGIVYSD